MMAPDRPAEASPLDHGRESEGSGIDDHDIHRARRDPSQDLD
jgi:hypothetical protein